MQEAQQQQQQMRHSMHMFGRGALGAHVHWGAAARVRELVLQHPKLGREHGIAATACSPALEHHSP